MIKNFSIILILFSFVSNAQYPCNISTITPNYNFYAGPPYNFIVGSVTTTPRFYLCANAIVYDTIPSGGRNVIIEQGATYTWKRCGPALSIIWIKSGGILNLLQEGCVTSTSIYYESGAIINDPFNVMNVPPSLCPSIVFPSLNCSTGIREQINNGSITLSSNPSSGSLNLQIDSDINNTSIIISNSLGQTIHQQNISKGINEIKLKDASTGLYYYTIFEKGKSLKNGKIAIEIP